jgi:Family of unknown function (DUF6230)
VEQTKQGLGGTRWRRFAAVMVPAVFVVGALGAGVANGAVPVTFDVSGGQFKITSTHLHGTDFTQYGSSVKVKINGSTQAVAESTIGGADISNLCQSVAQPFGPTVVWLKLTAGGGNTPAHADNLVIDMTHLTGDAKFTNINIGQDASDLSSRGTEGGFGQAADVVDITRLTQTAWATTAGSFTLPGLDLSLKLGGGDPCPDL